MGGGTRAAGPDLAAPLRPPAFSGHPPSFEAKPVALVPASPLAYRPDSVLDGWGVAGRLTVRAVSVRGSSHRFFGRPRQDDFALHWHEPTGTLAIAVADGVSAAPLSHVGASTVCRYALEFAVRALEEARPLDWPGVVRGCSWALVEATQRLEAQDAPDGRRAEELMATTLCLALVRVQEEGADVEAVAVGDTGLGRLDRGVVTRLVGAAKTSEGGITDHAVSALPRVPPEIQPSCFRFLPGETLLVATDGIWDPLGEGRGPVGRHLAAGVAGELPTREKLLRLVQFTQETHDDDRTLVVVRFEADELGRDDASAGLGGPKGEAQGGHHGES
jgi:serine/threonine protein phosphatase PrpC